MNIDHSFDYIIAGTGASGLSLLYHLLLSEDPLCNKKILTIDISFEPKADKTWCFWSQDHPFMHLTHKSWKKLKVISHGQEMHESLHNIGYHCIKSERYQNEVLEMAQNSSSVSMLEATIEGFDLLNHRGVVYTDKGSFSADWIFQSALKPPGYQHSVVDTSLIQHFTGWEIKTKDYLFDPETALLMDFDTEQTGGLTFFYLLPFSENSALVEYTIFSDHLLEKDTYNSAIRNYLFERFGLKSDQYSISRKEHGAIPMEDRKTPRYYNKRVLNLGINGGITKPTTGYTFTRAHQHSKEIVSCLNQGKQPSPYSGSPYRFRVYDIMLLYLLKHDPVNSRSIFHNLFKYNRIEQVLHFLDEKTTFTEDLEIFSTLPYTPFFRSIYHMRHRIFTGA
jgi:lycopene beta-cyclase